MENQENAIEKQYLEVTALTPKCLTLPPKSLSDTARDPDRGDRSWPERASGRHNQVPFASALPPRVGRQLNLEIELSARMLSVPVQPQRCRYRYGSIMIRTGRVRVKAVGWSACRVSV